MPTTFTSHANVLCLTKNPLSVWMGSNHRLRSCIWLNVLYQLSYKPIVAANCVASFFYRGHTSRLKFSYLAFNFSSQVSPLCPLFLQRAAIPFSIGGFIPPTALPTLHLNWLSVDATAASARLCKSFLHHRATRNPLTASVKYVNRFTDFHCLGKHRGLAS